MLRVVVVQACAGTDGCMAMLVLVVLLLLLQESVHVIADIMRLDYAEDWAHRHAKYGYTPLIRLCMKPNRQELARQLRLLNYVPGVDKLLVNAKDVRSLLCVVVVPAWLFQWLPACLLAHGRWSLRCAHPRGSVKPLSTALRLDRSTPTPCGCCWRWVQTPMPPTYAACAVFAALVSYPRPS